MYKICLIGGGIISTGYIEATEQLPNACLVGVAEIDAKRRAKIAERSEVAVFADYGEMLRKTHPDISIIALPHHLHLGAAEAALSSGSHVLIEKPLEISPERCDRLIEIAQRSGRQAFVGHTQRFYPHVSEAKRLLDSGTIGKPLLVTEVFQQRYFTHGRPRWYLDPKKAGGGILMNHGVHLVDRVSWLLDDRATRVCANLLFHPKYPGSEALAVVHLEFENGSRASLNVSGFGGDDSLTLVSCSDGTLLFDLSRKIVLKRVASEDRLYALHDEERRQVTLESRPLQSELESFLRSLDTGNPPEIGLDWGRYVVTAVHAAYQSARSGQPVSLA